MKNFHKVKFLRDLQQKPWSNVETLNDPNDMWLARKGMLMASIDKHAPLKSKRVGNKKSPWITDQLRHEMHKRHFLKKKAALDGNPLTLINTNVPGTIQITKLRRPSENISQITWITANQILKNVEIN